MRQYPTSTTLAGFFKTLLTSRGGGHPVAGLPARGPMARPALTPRRSRQTIGKPAPLRNQMAVDGGALAGGRKKGEAVPVTSIFKR